MIAMIYKGGVDKVEVILPSGRSIEVIRGETVRLLDNEADALRDHPEWELVTTKDDV